MLEAQDELKFVGCEAYLRMLMLDESVISGVFPL